MRTIDHETSNAVRLFIQRLAQEHPDVEAILFGSRARGGHRPDSDADLAVLIHGPHGRRVDEAMKMADIAFDVMLETGILIEPLPLWEEEWLRPEKFGNPPLLRQIQQEGVRL